MSLFTTFPAVDIHSAVTIPKLGDIKYSFFVMQEQSPDTSLLCNLTKNRKQKNKHKTSGGKKAACESIEKVIRNKFFFSFSFLCCLPCAPLLLCSVSFIPHSRLISDYFQNPLSSLLAFHLLGAHSELGPAHMIVKAG